MPSRLRTWLQLFRAPNLFTVPGDPLAGFLLANFGVLTTDAFPVIGASLCFYAAGLLDNDLADLAEDRAERPKRPLPSGAAHVGVVSAVAAALCLLGLFLCAAAGKSALGMGFGIVVAVLLYNHRTKRLPVVGAVNMGLCRALSVLLGASAAPSRMIPAEALIAALVIGLYIAGITNLARFETKSRSPLLAKWLPPAILVCALIGAWSWERIGMAGDARLGEIAMRLVLGLAILLSASIARRLSANLTAPLPSAIGQFIRLLLPIQSAFCAHTGGFGLIIAGLLLVAWPISRLVSKRFYAS